MKTFHVFIERTRDPSAVAKVAAAIGAKFGLPAGTLEGRLRAGRFRVKASVELARAQRIAGELEQLGAVCSIVDSERADSAAPIQILATPVPTVPPAKPAQSPPAQPAVAPRPPAPAPSTGSSAYQSGLSAAFGGASEQALGALQDQADGGAWKLSSLDGSEEEAPATPPFDPSMRELPTSDDDGMLTLMDGASGAAPPKPAPPDRSPAGELANPGRAPTATKPSAPPVDAFAPPEMSEEEQLLELAVKAPPKPPPKPSPSPPGPELSPEPTSTRSAPKQGGTVAPAESPVLRARMLLASDARARFAAGVFLAVILGFIPAHVISSMRESAAEAPIVAELREQYAAASDPLEYAGLGEIRQAKLELLGSRQSSIAITGCVLWAALGGGIAWLWFRKIDWARYASPSPRSSSGSGAPA